MCWIAINRLFQWHTYHYVLPPAAERLATAENHENQSIRVVRAVYGMQFHLEVTEPMVQNWIEATPNVQ